MSIDINLNKSNYNLFPYGVRVVQMRVLCHQLILPDSFVFYSSFGSLFYFLPSLFSGRGSFFNFFLLEKGTKIGD